MPEEEGEGVGGLVGVPFPDHSNAVAPPNKTNFAELESPFGPNTVVRV